MVLISRLLLVEHKVSVVEDQHELLPEGHIIALIEEERRFRADDNTTIIPSVKTSSKIG